MLILRVSFCILSLAWYVMALPRAVASESHSLKGSCIPANAPKDWKIDAIYLHGLLPLKSGTGGYADDDLHNRRLLEAWAEAHKVRIALPVSSKIGTYKKGRYRVWDGISVRDIEKAARESCHQAPLAEKRVLIGYSRGAYRTSKLAAEMCAHGAYVSVISIGKPGQQAFNECKTAHGFAAHDFPKAFSKFDHLLKDFLHHAKKAKPEPSAHLAPPTSPPTTPEIAPSAETSAEKTAPQTLN